MTSPRHESRCARGVASCRKIIQRTKREHPYEVSSIVAIPTIDGGPDYIGWILKETEAP